MKKSQNNEIVGQLEDVIANFDKQGLFNSKEVRSTQNSDQAFFKSKRQDLKNFIKFPKKNDPSPSKFKDEDDPDKKTKTYTLKRPIIFDERGMPVSDPKAYTKMLKRRHAYRVGTSEKH
jgi:hypothetical protein